MSVAFCESHYDTNQQMADSEIVAKGKTLHGGVGLAMPSATALMRWVYVGRVSVASTIFVAASFYFA